MASTNRTQLIPLVRDANKNRPAGKKIAVVGRTNDAIAKDLGISLSTLEVAVSPDDPFFDLYSPSNPYPDYTIAQAAAKAWEGELVEAEELEELDDDAIY